MNRRHFLIEAAGCMPCCLLPGDLIRRAAAALEAGDAKAALAAPRRAQRVLYALDEGHRFLLSLNSTRTEPSPLTWREWLDWRGVNADSPHEVSEYLIDQGHLCEDQALSDLIPAFDDTVSGQIMEGYIDWDWACSASPQAQAHHYLRSLALGNSDLPDGDPLGELTFYEGPMPGSNWTWVETDGGLVLAALQRRLLDLGENIRVEITNY